FFFPLPPPPSPTLFPYTTLFRSASEQRKAGAVAPLERREAALDRRHQIGRNPELPIALLLDHVARRVERALVQFGARRLEAIDLDRKSTRLNSSHLVISYAVFCL